MRQVARAQRGHGVIRDQRVEIVAAQRGVAAGGNHFEDALRQAQDGDIERAAAQVVHGVHAFRGMIQAVGDGRRRGFIQQAQDVQARKPGRVARGLTLGVVEIRGHRDDGAHQVVAQHVFRALTQHRQDLRGNLDRAQVALGRADAHHAGRVHEFIRRARGAGLFQRAAHEPLHRHHGVQRIFGLLRQGLAAGRDLAAGKIAHRRRQQGMALRVGQHFGNAAAHGGNQRIGSAQVDPDRQLALVRRGRLTGLGYLQ
ncbi:NAD-specific glutamate dehydrogenase [compost metagenome]